MAVHSDRSLGPPATVTRPRPHRSGITRSNPRPRPGGGMSGRLGHACTYSTISPIGRQTLQHKTAPAAVHSAANGSSSERTVRLSRQVGLDQRERTLSEFFRFIVVYREAQQNQKLKQKNEKSEKAKKTGIITRTIAVSIFASRLQCLYWYGRVRRERKVFNAMCGWDS